MNRLFVTTRTLALVAMLLAQPAAAAILVNAGEPGTTGVSAVYATTLVGNDTLAPDTVYLGTPDDAHADIGRRSVTYDFGSYRIVNGAGLDFNIYEGDNGGAEFDDIFVSLSFDGLSWAPVDTSFQALDLAGDEQHDFRSLARGYDIADFYSGLEFRYLRVEGTPFSFQTASFDLDAVGVANFTSAAVPEPATWAMLITGFGVVGATVRRRRRLAAALA